MAKKPTSSDLRKKAAVLRAAVSEKNSAAMEQVYSAERRANELSIQEVLAQAIQEAADEAEAMAFVYGTLLNLRNDTAKTRVVEYAMDKLYITAASGEVHGEIQNLQQQVAVLKAKAEAKAETPLRITPASTYEWYTLAPSVGISVKHNSPGGQVAWKPAPGSIRP